MSAERKGEIMGLILLVIIGVMCIGQGVRAYSSEEQNRIFTRYPIKVKDVKEYNKFCGALMIGFGIAAEITLFIMLNTTGILSTLLTLAVIAEAFIVLFIYRKKEPKYRIK